MTVHNTLPDTVANTIAKLSAVDMVAAFASRTLSPVEVYDAVEELIGEVEPVINAFYVRDQIAARSEAEASATRWVRGEPLGPIDGVPVTLKENIARKGVPMPAGTACSEALPALADAPITARVKESGAVVLGSTTMPDWGMLSSGVSSLHGITRSPWNPAWTTGGSSAGAGAAAAAGFGPLHVGTDIGGSIRLPGTWLGLVAHKPSLGGSHWMCLTLAGAPVRSHVLSATPPCSCRCSANRTSGTGQACPKPTSTGRTWISMSAVYGLPYTSMLAAEWRLTPPSQRRLKGQHGSSPTPVP